MGRRALVPAPDSGTLRRHLAVLLAADGDSQMTHHTTPAQAEGLYDPRFEHDACGVAMVARLDDEQTHEVVRRALDGAGQPRAPRAPRAPTSAPATARASWSSSPTRSCAASPASSCPPPGRYGVGVCFLPHDPARRAKLEG